MAVVVQSSAGWLLHHRDFFVLHVKCTEQTKVHEISTELETKQLNSAKEFHSVGINLGSYEKTETKDFKQSNTLVNDECKTFKTYKLKKDLFRIVAPFKMDSQCIPVQAFSLVETDVQCSSQQTLNSKTDTVQIGAKRKKQKKRKKPLNVGEELAARFHIEVHDKILNGYNDLTEAARMKGYFRPNSPVIVADNNTAARLAAQLTGPGDAFGQICWESRHICGDVHLIGDNDCAINQLGDACNRIYRNSKHTSVHITVDSHRYLIPPHSTFIMSDVSVLNTFSQDIGPFDFIVMDPPWLNKSVKRKKTYFNLQNDILLDLPLDKLMQKGCIIVVWVTNRCKHINFVKQELFRKYKITYLATWFWLKITKNGDMVYDINSEHKKPYETLIIGQFQKTTAAKNSDHISIEENKVIVSVPCSLHSKKPPLYEIMKDYLPEKPECLELFARNLLPHWTSWGNEESSASKTSNVCIRERVLLHQHEDFYEEIT